MEIEYIGEALIYRDLGHFAIIFGFVMSLLAAAGYFFATQNRENQQFTSWRKIGRFAFTAHGISVFVVIGCIFVAMLEKRFEYHYVWQHVSEDLPFRYIFSAFWEGQEGSFLLWMFWHVVLGFILLRKAGKWESPVLSVVSLVQFFIFSMILGVYIFDETKIGSNPLILLREAEDFVNLPLFANADYVGQIQGTGLNPLLQNYWMTIHPPTLFLGFASTVVPFAFAIAGLWTREYKEWLKPALPWALFSGAILGTGILMGGAWAYEALSFGGYWAWDPVENMSLVPWIILVAGIHMHLVAKSTGYSVRSTYLFYIFSFVLVLYSTYLTRSGILGESSVHSFTEMGLENQLILFILAFLSIGLVLFFFRMKEIAAPVHEEKFSSREFWMFIGTMVLLFSSVIITASTSLPVFNKIVQAFNPDFTGFNITDPVDYYNDSQLWIAVFIGVLTGVAQFLRYREPNWSSNSKRFWKHMAIAASVGVLLTIVTSFWIEMGNWQYWLLTFTGIFTVIANADYIFSGLRGNLKMAGSAFAHLGFGLMVVGIVASGLNKQHISTNPVMQRGLLDEERLQENVLLFKQMPMFMSGYRVTYERDTMIGNLREFYVKYEKLNEAGEPVEQFHVVPTATYDNKAIEVKAFNPSTKRYLDRDIFSHIATLPMKEADFRFAREQEDSMDYQVFNLGKENPIIILDTVEIKKGETSILPTKAQIVALNKEPNHPDYEPEEGDFAFGLELAFEKDDSTFTAEPVLVLRQGMLYTYPVQMNDLSFKVRLTDQTLNAVFPPEEELGYRNFTFKQGDAITLNGMRIRFNGFDKEPKHPGYAAKEGDIAVGAIFDVAVEGNSEVYQAQPLYLIRDSSPFNLKDEVRELGLHFRFVSIDPLAESIEVMIAQKENALENIPVQIAKKSYRTDYIVLEAIIFPGINLFWLGSTLMMIGLAIAMFFRLKKRA